MMKADRTIRLVTSNDKEQWNSVVNHPLQSWEWGEFRHAMGLTVARLGIYEKNKLVSGWQLTFHPIPFLPFTIGYMPKGPTPDAQMTRELKKLGISNRALFIQLEPDTPSTDPFTIHTLHDVIPSHRPLFTKYTFVLDLTKSEDELLKAMHSKTRYNIRIAQKHNVIISEDNSDSAFAAYLKLAYETTKRQGFYAHNKTYHRTMWRILHKSDIAHLFTATYEKNVLAAWILFVFKDTVYYPYGASSRMNREVMAPNLLLWEIVRWAKKKGLFYFDLWGALGPNPDLKDPWYGFHRFKEGYHPEIVEFIGSYDLVIRPFLYRLFILIDSVRWSLLNMKSRGH